MVTGKLLRYWLPDLLALLAGALFVFSLAPFNFWPLAFVTPGVLYLVTRTGSVRRVMFRFYLYNLGMFGVGASWIYVSVHVYGHEIRLLKKSERGAWTIETRDRLHVLLGKEDLKARMQRFLTVIDRLQNEGKRIARIDARYINGVAVQFAKDDQINLADITQSVGEQSL